MRLLAADGVREQAIDRQWNGQRDGLTAVGGGIKQR